MMRFVVVVALLSLAAPAWAQDRATVGGWFSAGTNPAGYEMGVDHKVKFRGKGAGFVRAREPNTPGIGTLMQIFKANEYRGKRIRLAAIVRTEDVVLAGLWMRVDLPARREGAFDDMSDRPIRGTTPWMRYTVVLDVPLEATELAFGLLVAGAGTAWIDDVKLQVVDATVPVTAMAPLDYPERPANLDFEDDPRPPEPPGKSLSDGRMMLPSTREKPPPSALVR